MMTEDEIRRRNAVLQWLAEKKYHASHATLSAEKEFKLFEVWEGDMKREQRTCKPDGLLW